MSLSPQFSIYEINTWVWLAGLKEKLGRPVDLSSVPAAQWDAIAAYGFSIVWLMGVWERSPAGKAIANRNAQLMDDFRRCLPDVRAEDNVGSAYCVRRYVVDAHLGGPEGLAVARQELARRGMRLLLDFVPNHVAPDSPWITQNPEHFIRGTAADLETNPGAWLALGGQIFACGRDPYFPPWPDVVQVNAFEPGYRSSVLQYVLSIAEQCDGIRCDMAMLLLNDIFVRTWGGAAGDPPAEEYWPQLIDAVHRQAPSFLFIAEAYWDLEWTLQHQGFAFCYDKRLYDRVVHEDADGLRQHLQAPLSFQCRLIRFIENHDEPRVAALFSAAKARAAAVVMATVPGSRLFHDGQFEGRRIRVPVFLGRGPEEAVASEVKVFYQTLLATIQADVFREGEWELLFCSGWPDNATFRNMAAWCWARGDDRRLVAVNLSETPAQGRVHLPWNDLRGKSWRLVDALSSAQYDRDGSEMQTQGLFVALDPWLAQVLSLHSEREPQIPRLRSGWQS